jgi:hypothetical protein
MRLARGMAKALLIFIVLCEVGVVWQLWRHGPPMEMAVTSDKVKETGELSFKMVRVPLRAEDYLVLGVVLALQASLVGFLWWSGRKIALVNRESGTGSEEYQTVHKDSRT